MIDIDDLREQVRQISEAVIELRESGITERALIHLIQQSAPGDTSRGPRYGRKPNKRVIQAVLDGMEGLEEYVFGEEDDEQTL